MALGVIAGCVGIIIYQRSRPATVPADRPIIASTTFLLRGQSLRVEAWNDSATGQLKGSIVCFPRVAISERTADGGAKIYVPTPIEEIRENVRALEQLAR